MENRQRSIRVSGAMTQADVARRVWQDYLRAVLGGLVAAPFLLFRVERV